MSKIKAVAVAMHPNGENLYIVDQAGRLWVKLTKNLTSISDYNGGWHLVELPEEPVPPMTSAKP